MANEFNGWEFQDVVFKYGELSGRRPRCVKTGIQVVKDATGEVYVSTSGADLEGVVRQWATEFDNPANLGARGDMGWYNPQPIIMEPNELGTTANYDDWRGFFTLGIV
jgi:hypothetical protein